MRKTIIRPLSIGVVVFAVGVALRWLGGGGDTRVHSLLSDIGTTIMASTVIAVVYEFATRRQFVQVLHEERETSALFPKHGIQRT